jgi:SAM-dependent methyltransferase
VTFVVPEQFNRNAKNVQELGLAADTGLSLIRYMCERIGIPDLGGLDVLDFGCGTRFADTIINRDVQLKTYVGIDVFKPMIDFLSENVSDPRLSFHYLNAWNPIYNPDGEPMSPATVLPTGKRTFDIACMFSVITHQLPADALSILTILRGQVRPNASLFFSACLEEGDFGYREGTPESPTALSIYAPALIKNLLQSAGWRIISIEPPNANDLPILDSILCVPN